MHAVIIGAAGYTGGELIRLLVQHPKVGQITAVSSSQKGKKVGEVHKDLFYLHMIFQDDWTSDDVVFLAVGHGEAAGWMNKLSNSSSVIIDLSRDHRVGSDFVYGLTEWNKNELIGAKRIANPGCFATAIQLTMLPLVAKDVPVDGLSITAITGSTGAGYKPGVTTHFSNRNNNLSTYKVFEHEHLLEMEQSVKKFSFQKQWDLSFVPVRGNFSRGILSMAQFISTIGEKELLEIFHYHYDHQTFVHVSEGGVELKQVVNTNHALIGLEKKNNKVLITCAIDNLLKGASGQAVQNMNVALGFAESDGLQLKSIAY